MKRLITYLIAAALSASTVGCFHHTFTIGTGAPEGTQVYKNWHHHWLFGIIRPKHQKEVKLEEFCPSGNATINEETSFLNGLVDALIGIIYSPTTVTILCDDGSEQELTLTEDEVSALVTDPLFLTVVAEVVPERLAEAELALAGVEDTPGEMSSVLAAR
jgi:hypothetical protein